MPEYAPCPECGSTRADKVSFTWWGGLLGPAMLSHVQCRRCGACYNGRSGNSNNTAITIYIVVSFLIGFGLCGCIILANVMTNIR